MQTREYIFKQVALMPFMNIYRCMLEFDGNINCINEAMTL